MSGIIKISKEILQIQKGNDLSIAAAAQESDVRHVKALIIGPPGTPYEYGFFEFAIRVGTDYPSKPPKVDAKTTNNGRCRFNPNIYAAGKVCLSILGTWAGEHSGEEWSSAQGLESILWSIQSLMSNDPVSNEPGFEKTKSGEWSCPEHEKMNDAYVAKIRHETIRIAVIQKLEEALGIQTDGTLETAPPSPSWDSEDSGDPDRDYPEEASSHEKSKFEPFSDLFKRRFLWYYETYLTTVDEFSAKDKDGKSFERMSFEGEGNIMRGKFEYSSLHKRLLRIKEVIDLETARWAEDGLNAEARESGLSASLRRQLDQLVEHHKATGVYNISIDLENKNPFVWVVTYFGKPMTHLDGGVFKIRVTISTKYPEEQPRVKMETPIYHHRVSKEGILCYFPKKQEEMRNHMQAIVEALEEESPPFDPLAVVHPEATKLLWGTPDEKKKYYRLLQRSAQRTTEE